MKTVRWIREALKHAVVDYKVGSILNTTAHALSVEKWREIQTAIQDEAKKTRLKIPVIYGLDGMHGQTYTLNSTLFPKILPWPPRGIPIWWSRPPILLPMKCVHPVFAGNSRRYWIAAVSRSGQGFRKHMEKMYISAKPWVLLPFALTRPMDYPIQPQLQPV